MVIKGVSKLLGDCKMENMKKLKEKGMSTLEAQNASLTTEVADLKVELALRNKEIRELKMRAQSLKQIRKVVGTPRNILNKARF